jgi:hypothetical protein
VVVQFPVRILHAAGDHEVNRVVNSVKNDVPERIEPIGEPPL